MKILRAFAAAGVLVAPAFALDESPALPAWQGKQRAELEAAGWVPGALLLTGEPIPGEPAEPTPDSLQLEPPKPEEIAGDLVEPVRVAEKFISAYFAERPQALLVDPQGLLSPADFRDRLGFLNYHASDSSIDLFVYVLAGDQEFPSEVREEETMERFFSTGRPAALVYYYLGAPERSILYLSPSLTGVIPPTEQHRALESSVMQASEKTHPAEQIDKFLVQMSIRLYWMERLLKSEPAAAVNGVVPAAAVVAATHGKAKSAKFLFLQALAGKIVLPAGILLGICFVTFVLSRLLRLRARYRFPEFEVEPRLGGAHAAGVGAVISFASAAVPPASQRTQVPEYLRRA